MSPKPPYIIDSDVRIPAKNSYYSFEICPGFWRVLSSILNLAKIQSG